MYSTLSISLISPSSLSKLPVFSSNPSPKTFDKAGYKIFLSNVDFPDPETPVISVNAPSGISASIFFRLFSLAPKILMDEFHSLLFLGTGISNFLF